MVLVGVRFQRVSWRAHPHRPTAPPPTRAPEIVEDDIEAARAEVSGPLHLVSDDLLRWLRRAELVDRLRGQQ